MQVMQVKKIILSLFIGLTTLTALTTSTFARTDIDANNIVNKLLKNIYPSGETSFIAGLKVCEYTDSACINEDTETYDRKVKIYLGNIQKDILREHSTFIDVFFPIRQKKTILHDGKKLYLLLPNTKTPIRIPPQQTLLGDADVGAILDIDYSIYKSKILSSNDKTVTLEFTHPAKKQQFSRIILNISLLSYTPLSGDFYSSTGALIRHAKYMNIGNLGQRITFRRVIVDSLLSKNSSVTLIDYISEEGVKIPSFMFSKSKMTNFRSKY
ncbi:outer membrane lipoprotein-sorting protein [Vibrio sp.]|nr:outer membrane lipoprotein-sorting protein [Vibrio sp.]